MKITLTQLRVWLPSLIAAAGCLGAAAPAHANKENNCIVDIALAEGEDNWHYHGDPDNTRQIGYWDVDNGGASSMGQQLGSHFINLSASLGSMATQNCIQDIKLTAGNWEQQRNAPTGYTEVGWWDVDDGGSLDSDKRATTHRMTLFIKRMAKTENPPKDLQVVKEVGMVISDTKPTTGIGNQRSPHSEYRLAGWWDVDRDKGCGNVYKKEQPKQGQTKVVYKTEKTCGAYGAELLVQKVPFVNLDAVQAVTLTGRWELLNACRGAKCNETSYEITVGAEKGKEVSSSSTVGKSLSVMLGLEVSVGGGFEAGGASASSSVTSKLEVTGQLSSEQQNAIMNSFTISRQAATSVKCSGASDMWQWRSALVIQRTTGVEEVKADSLLTVCAPSGVKPKHPNDISWNPDANAPREDQSQSKPSSGQSIPLPNQSYRIQSNYSNKCIDGPQGPEGKLHQWDCHTNNWQKWVLKPQSSGVYRLVNSHTQRCLGVVDGQTANRSAVGAWKCNDHKSQQVRLEQQGDATVIIFAHSNKCLDAPGENRNKGAGLQQWDCHKGSNQLFKLTPM